MHRDTKCIGSCSRNRVQVFDRIIKWSGLEQRLIDVRLSSAEQDRVAVGAGACDCGSAQRRAAAANVFNHHRSDKWLQLVRPWASNEVECTARRKGNYKPNWLSRIG